MSRRTPRFSRGTLFFAGIACVIGAVACGNADPPGGDQAGHAGHLGGSTDTSQSTPSPKDAGASFRDPDAGDAGCKSPNKVCGTACVAVGSDPEHCGSCDNTCVGPSATCLAGQCACGPGYDYCQGTGCMDVSSDTNNCGACGKVCDPNQFNACVAGQCVQQ